MLEPFDRLLSLVGGLILLKPSESENQPEEIRSSSNPHFCFEQKSDPAGTAEADSREFSLAAL